jgi:hypothetical protein
VSEISATVSKEGRDGGRAHLQQNDGEAARRRPRRAHTAGWPPLPPAALGASGRRRPGKAEAGFGSAAARQQRVGKQKL